jgi:hypothetical protein
VLVGNTASPPETWEWDGRDWTQLSPVASPPAGSLWSAGLAFDIGRARTVLFDAQAGQTWEWNGTNWSQVTTAQVPTPRYGFRLAYDLVRARTVLFGGEDGSRQHNVFHDTWEYDGVNWIAAATANFPPGRSEYAMCFDLQQARVVLYGGRVNQTLLNDTWSYDGTTWVPAALSPTPLAVDPAMALDVDGHVLLFTGSGPGAGSVPTLWDWNGSAWTQRQLPATPAVREMHAMTTDSTGNVLLFGGYNAAINGSGGQVFNDTWTFNGTDWQSAPAVGPSARGFCQVAKDTARNRVVLFGGEGNNAWSGDTWEWNGAIWQPGPAAGPAPRSRGAMTFDAVHGRCVLHGGTDGTQYFGDTWLYDGTQWQQANTPTAPGARADHAMAYDSARGLVFLFGGQLNGATAANDLWQWNGSAWTQIAASTPPAPRGLHDFTYDPDRARFVLHGSDTANDTWEWDGLATWTQVANGDRAPTATSTGATWDGVRHRIVLWDGSGLWAYSPLTASTASYGSGCGAVTPELVADGRPFLGSRPFGFEIAHASAGGLAGLCGSMTAGSSPLPGGCTVLLQSPVTWGLAPVGANNIVQFSLQVPPVAAFKSLPFFTQGAVLTSTGAITLTQGIHCTVGD